MKRLIAVLMAAMILLCMGGCIAGTKKGADTSAEHKIAVAVYDVTDDEVIAFREYLTDYIQECFPEVEFMYSYAIRSAEDEMAFLKEACENGAEGVMSFITYDLSEEVAYCASKGVYYMLASGTVTDEAYESVAEDPYFVGVVGPGREIEHQAGVDMAEYFINEMDGDQYILFTGGASIGNEMHRERAVGALEVFEREYGDLGQSAETLAVTEKPVKLTFDGAGLTIFPGYTTREEIGAAAKKELESADYDFALSMFSMYSMVDVFRKEGIKQGVIDCYSMTNKDLFADGTLCYVAGKFSSTIGPSFAAMYNAITGYGEDFRQDGRAFKMTQGFWISKDKKEYNDQYALATGIYVNAYDHEDLRSVMKAYDTSASFKRLKALTEAYTREDAQARRDG